MKKKAIKKIIALSLSAVLSAVSLAGCQTKTSDSGLTPITLNEVAHSIFYAPQYAAIELGYFEDEGIDLTLVNGIAADQGSHNLVSSGAVYQG